MQHTNQNKYNHESRIIRLEENNENIKETLNRLEKTLNKLDNRMWMNFYWMIGGFASVLIIIAHGFHWI